MELTISQRIKAKYGINELTEEEYKKLKDAILIGTDTSNMDLRSAMLMNDKLIQTISKVTGVNKKVLECLTIQNIEDMFTESDIYYDIQKTLIDLIKLYNASKKVNAQKLYSVMARKRWNEEYEYWVFQDDNEESIDHLNSYKSIRDYGMFKYTCHVDITLESL